MSDMEKRLELAVSEETRERDYDARRDSLSAEVTGEAAMIAEPLESILWAVPKDPLLIGIGGTKRIIKAARDLDPFFEQFAHEQATGTGPSSVELTQRLRRVNSRMEL